MLCIAGFGGTPVLAGEFGYLAGDSLTYDSNINRVSNGAIAEWTQSLIGGLAYQESSADLSARLLARVERRNYLRNSYNDENIYDVNGAAVWTISPQQFTWTVEDVARQVQLNITAPDTPSNRTNTNSLGTGPDFTFRLDPTNNVDIAARYTRFTINGPGDTKIYSGRTDWVHRVSELTTLSLNYAAARRINLDPSPFGDTRLEEQYLRFETRPPLGVLTIDAGTGSFAQEGVENQKRRLARLTFFRSLTSASSLQVSFLSQYSSTSRELLAGVISPTQSTPAAPSTPSTIVAATDVYYSRSSDIYYQNRSSRYCGFALRRLARSVDSPQAALQDFEELGGRIDCDWLYSPARIRAYTDYARRTYPEPFRRDGVLSAGVAVSYTPNQNVDISVDAARVAQSSSQAQYDFVDQRVMLSLTYSSGTWFRR
jgi:hypothetical protein